MPPLRIRFNLYLTDGLRNLASGTATADLTYRLRDLTNATGPDLCHRLSDLATGSASSDYNDISLQI
jgi:hypothetical protein